MSSNNHDTEDDHLFRAFVNDITPLSPQTIEPTQIKPKVRVNQRANILAPNIQKKISTLDENDVFFAFHISKKVRKQFKAGKVCFDASLDLHGYTIVQSERLLSQFINDCQQQLITYAIIVHGQGHNSAHGSVLKPTVLYWLSQQESIDAYCSAQSRDGGKGASYILIAELSC